MALKLKLHIRPHHSRRVFLRFRRDEKTGVLKCTRRYERRVNRCDPESDAFFAKKDALAAARKAPLQAELDAIKQRSEDSGYRMENQEVHHDSIVELSPTQVKPEDKGEEEEHCCLLRSTPVLGLQLAKPEQVKQEPVEEEDPCLLWSTPGLSPE